MSMPQDFSSLNAYLLTKSPEDLKQLSENSEEISKLVNNLREIKDLQSEKERLISQNKNKAEGNLEKKPEFEEMKFKLVEAYEKLDKLKTELAEQKSELDGVQDNRAPDTVHALLQAEVAQIEQDTEAMAELFLNGETGVDSFMELFVERRTVAHMRRIKSEKMGEMLREMPNATTAARSHSSPTVAQSTAAPSHINMYGQQAGSTTATGYQNASPGFQSYSNYPATTAYNSYHQGYNYSGGANQNATANQLPYPAPRW